MGRGNAAARVAQAKQRLQATAEAQAEIGRQAIEAIDNGIDVETVVAIAEAAAKEVSVPEEPSPMANQYEEHVKQQEAKKQAVESLARQQTRRIKFTDPESELPAERKGSTLTNKPYVVRIDADGFAEVAEEVAQHLVENSNGKYVYAE